MGFDPVLVDLDGESPNEPQRALLMGKMRMTWVRRLISWLSRSSMSVLLRCLWCSRGSR